MRALFRVDSGKSLGIGHVMRCLTIANSLKEKGVDCHFVCRDHKGHKGDLVALNGHSLSILTATLEAKPDIDGNGLDKWLGAPAEQDIRETQEILTNNGPFNIILTDHYAIDAQWHQAMRSYCDKIVAIDDLANRPLDCDVLIDQTLNRNPDDYTPFTPAHCQKLCGTNYALLRPVFRDLNPKAIVKRKQYTHIKRLLVTMGGGDNDGATKQVIEALCQSNHSDFLAITIDVIISDTHPTMADIKDIISHSKLNINIHNHVTNIEEMMFEADLSIGTCGATSWERACLGLPALLHVAANNQLKISEELVNERAAKIITVNGKIDTKILELEISKLNQDHQAYNHMCDANFKICDGLGTQRLIESLL